MKALLAAAAIGMAVLLNSCEEAKPGSVTVGPTVAEAQPEDPNRGPDVVFVPTPEIVVDAMLKLAEVKPGDVVYDLGSGDGRIPIAAARDFGVRPVGTDIDPQRVAEARANAEAAGLADRITFRQADLFQTDLTEADVVTLYLLQSLNVKLRPKLLRELKPGSRIVSHDFDMGVWKPTKVHEVNGSKIYLWIVPERSSQ